MPQNIRAKCVAFWMLSALLTAMVSPAAVQQPQPPWQRPVFFENAEALDGDTLVEGAARVHLYGIQTPDLSATCLGPSGLWP